QMYVKHRPCHVRRSFCGIFTEWISYRVTVDSSIGVAACFEKEAAPVALSLADRRQNLLTAEGEWATRPPPLAIRRPQLPRATSRKGCGYCRGMSLPFRPASRRTAQAGRLCYQTIFETRL